MPEGSNGTVPAGSPRATVSLLVTPSGPVSALGALLADLPPCVDEVVVVIAAGSASDLPDGAPGPDVRVVIQAEPGRGHALRAALEAATGDLIVAMDGDGRMSPAEIPGLVYFLERGFDLVRGSRLVAGGGSIELTGLRRAGTRALVALANHWFEAGITDLSYGYFAVRRRFLDHLELTATGEEIGAEVAVRAALAGLRIAELPSRERPCHPRSDWRQFLALQMRVLETLVRLPRARHGAGQGRGGAGQGRVGAGQGRVGAGLR